MRSHPSPTDRVWVQLGPPRQGEGGAPLSPIPDPPWGWDSSPCFFCYKGSGTLVVSAVKYAEVVINRRMRNRIRITNVKHINVVGASGGSLIEVRPPQFLTRDGYVEVHHVTRCRIKSVHSIPQNFERLALLPMGKPRIRRSGTVVPKNRVRTRSDPCRIRAPLEDEEADIVCAISDIHTPLHQKLQQICRITSQSFSGFQRS